MLRDNVEQLQEAAKMGLKYSQALADMGVSMTYDAAARSKALATEAAARGKALADASMMMTYDAAARGKALAGASMMMTYDAATRSKELATDVAARGKALATDAATIAQAGNAYLKHIAHIFIMQFVCVCMYVCVRICRYPMCLCVSTHLPSVQDSCRSEKFANEGSQDFQFAHIFCMLKSCT